MMNAAPLTYVPAENVFEEDRSFAVVIVASDVKKHQHSQQNGTQYTPPDN